MIGSISQRMLTLTLRGLERDGLVKRTMFPTIPPRVDYELTDLGQGLTKPMQVLGQLGAGAHPGDRERTRQVRREQQPDLSGRPVFRTIGQIAKFFAARCADHDPLRRNT